MTRQVATPRAMPSARLGLRRRRQDRREGFRPGLRHLRAAGGGHDGDEALHPLRVVDRDELRDHPAHRGAGDMGAVDPERPEEGGGVGRHVVEAVGRRHGPAGSGLRDDRAEVGRAERVEMGGPAGVAVVEPDHPKALGRQAQTERIRPVHHGRHDAHDQENGRIGHATEALIDDVDPVGSDVWHDGSGCGKRVLSAKGAAAKARRPE